MPKAIEASALIVRRAGRPEGALTKEVRACLELLASGNATVVAVDYTATREQVATKVSRLSADMGIKVSVHDTADGGVGLEYRGTRENSTPRKRKS